MHRFYTVPQFETYYPLVINCQRQPLRMSYNITGSISVKNAGGHELYCGTLPNITSFRVFAVLWCGAFVCWLALRVKHDCTTHHMRRIRDTHDLGKRLPHWSLLVVAFVQALYCCVAASLWKRIDTVGKLPTLSGWEGPQALSGAYFATRTLADLASYGVVFLLATGVRISRRHMTPKMGLACAALALFLGFSSLMNSPYQPITLSSVCGLHSSPHNNQNTKKQEHACVWSRRWSG